MPLLVKRAVKIAPGLFFLFQQPLEVKRTGQNECHDWLTGISLLRALQRLLHRGKGGSAQIRQKRTNERIRAEGCCCPPHFRIEQREWMNSKGSCRSLENTRGCQSRRGLRQWELQSVSRRQIHQLKNRATNEKLKQKGRPSAFMSFMR